MKQVQGNCRIVLALDGDMNYHNTVLSFAQLPTNHCPVLFYWGKWERQRLILLRQAMHEKLHSIIQPVIIRIDTEPDNYGTWDVPEADFYRLLELFDHFQIKVTFVTVGKLAEIKPKLIKQIYLRGHEIALHGYEHNRLEDLQNYQEKRA